jgi:hypothetical protein
VPNKVTRERAILAERALLAAKAEGKMLAKEILAEFLELFRSLALKHQNNETKFLRWAKLSVDTARVLAPYQSPHVAPITLPADAPKAPAQPRIRFGLRIFERGKLIEEIPGDDMSDGDAA